MQVGYSKPQALPNGRQGSPPSLQTSYLPAPMRKTAKGCSRENAGHHTESKSLKKLIWDH